MVGPPACRGITMASVTAGTWMRNEVEEQTHDHEAEELHPHGGEWLREVVFGLNDGLVTTLVFILAVSSVARSHLVLIALGEVVAGGISMTLGGYLSSRTTHDIVEHQIATERLEITHEPGEERAELRAIYRRKGLHEPLLDRVVEHLTADKERWLRSMVTDELGILEGERQHPMLDGLLIGGAFTVGGLIPTLPFLIGLAHPRLWAYGLTALTALLLGSIKSRYTLKSPLRAGLEFLAIVSIGTAAGAAVSLVLHA